MTPEYDMKHRIMTCEWNRIPGQRCEGRGENRL